MNNVPTGSLSSLSGALRYIDSTAVRRGLATVRECRSLSLGLPIAHGAGPVAAMRQPPQHYMLRDGADYVTETGNQGLGLAEDVILLATHGTTHLDAFCHVFGNGVGFGGLSTSEVPSSGAKQLGVETIPPLATRALVVDAVPPGRQWLDPGESISVEHIQKSLAQVGLDPQPGDALLIRTGWVDAYYAGVANNDAWPGLAADCADWAIASQFSILGADNIAVEVGPSEFPDCALPLTMRLVRDEGVLFLELLDLRSVAGRTFEAFFTINPLRIVGGTGSPVAPMLLL